MKNKTPIRHGDVIIIPCDGIPADAVRLQRNELAYGEVTGHAHRIDVGELFETKDGKLYLKVDKMTKVSHEEHKPLTLTAGVYFVGLSRQYDEKEGWIPVRD